MNKHLVEKSNEIEKGQSQNDRPASDLPVCHPGIANLLKLQQQIGNQTVQRMFNASPIETERQVETSSTQRQEEEEEQELDTSGLGMQMRGQGHGNLGRGSITSNLIQRENGRSSGGVRAFARLRSNAPTITRRPMAEIASSHGRPNVAGWTTPRFEFEVPYLTSRQINFIITMDYDIELASEFTSSTLSVLQDHEMGHVKIGHEKGQAHLADDLEANLKSMSTLTNPAVAAARDNAVAVFRNEEGLASEDYDSIDYPRMHQAYLGARTPLSELESSSWQILTTSTLLRLFNRDALTVDQSTFRVLANRIVEASASLSTDERSQLQYNPEFKALVNRASQIIDEYAEIFQYDFWMAEFSTLDESTTAAMENLRTTLAGFTWQAPPG